ncbi:hypothetical protein [Photobacterium damselae]|uniref:Uncharacterized protein n=1 Tax=Photobacterium damselae TaxID=38293 RepID=A0A2T3QD12_PHODM|nr:hypothetical protein [Photobacterium damselae]KAB1512011.1 hypothetical protein FD717_010535 [Photobacterium damselae subsp. damselae]PSW82044.1 hypothetical protein CTN07_18295 [Photobacterium damselae]TLS72283.1 hypothetical protein FD718_02845 [Photobacterium damselae subsp. damselae]TLS80263.1 hypothetical protein FD721_01675 [Photobacterium damselae subsp. damselae]TLS82900.1 hypothetical protein FD720_21095 [Photobacterium damselae subsp. damselae]
MKTQSLTNAIAALREQVKARHSADKTALLLATEQVKKQEPYSSQVQQALIGNSEGKTLKTVTARWVKQRLQQ